MPIQKPGNYRNDCRWLSRPKEQAEGIQNNPRNNQINLSRLTGTKMKVTTTKTITELKESQKMFTHPVRHAGKQISPQSNGILELMRSLDRPRHKRPERQDQVLQRDNNISLNDSAQLQPKI